ncbi:MAG: hypothetical protein ACOCZ4_01005 [Bacteroidota bacterium]
MKRINIILIIVTAFFFASCSTTLKQRTAVDDLYFNPSERTEYTDSEEDISNEYESILAKQEQESDTVIPEKEEESSKSGFDRVLVDDYQTAYKKRQEARRSPSYGMSDYYSVRFSDDYFYASAYDPSFYNIIILGNDVWVEPHYLTSHFGIGWRYNRFYNSPYSHHYGYFGMNSFHPYHYSPFYHSPYYSYGFGYNYGYYGSSYYGHYGYYGNYYPYYTSPTSTYEYKRKEDRRTLVSRDAETVTNARPRVQSKEQSSQKAGSEKEGDRRRVTRERATDREQTARSRYIRRTDDGKRASTYNRERQESSNRYEERERINSLARYTENKERQARETETRRNVNRNYTRPDNTERSVRKAIREAENRRSNYSRNNDSNSSVRRSRSNNNSSGSNSSSGTRVKSSSSSSSSSGNNRSSSSSSSSGRKRK